MNIETPGGISGKKDSVETSDRSKSLEGVFEKYHQQLTDWCISILRKRKREANQYLSHNPESDAEEMIAELYKNLLTTKSPIDFTQSESEIKRDLYFRLYSIVNGFIEKAKNPERYPNRRSREDGIIHRRPIEKGLVSLKDVLDEENEENLSAKIKEYLIQQSDHIDNKSETNEEIEHFISVLESTDPQGANILRQIYQGKTFSEIRLDIGHDFDNARKLVNKALTALTKIFNRTNQKNIRNLAWDEMSKDYWWYKEGERAHMPVSFEDFYKRRIKDKKHQYVLDIGCGTGKFMIPMLQDGLNVVGLEPSRGMRRGAEINLHLAQNTLQGKAQLVEGESKHLEFPDGSFDVIFAKGSIHHNTWIDIQQSFKEAARVLLSGGYFIFQGRSPKDSAFSRSTSVAGDAGYTTTDTEGTKEGVVEHYFTKRELEELSAKNGLQIEVQPEEVIRSKGGGKKVNARWWVVYRKI